MNCRNGMISLPSVILSFLLHSTEYRSLYASEHLEELVNIESAEMDYTYTSNVKHPHPQFFSTYILYWRKGIKRFAYGGSREST